MRNFMSNATVKPPFHAISIVPQKKSAANMLRLLLLTQKHMQSWGGTSDAFCTQGRVKKGTNTYAILSYSSHSEPNGLNRNKTVFSVTFQNIKNPKKPYKISIFDAKHQKYKQFVPSSIIGNQIPNLRRWRDVGGM